MSKSARVIDDDYDPNDYENVIDVSVPDNGTLIVKYDRDGEGIVEVYAPDRWIRVVYREGNEDA